MKDYDGNFLICCHKSQPSEDYVATTQQNKIFRKRQLSHKNRIVKVFEEMFRPAGSEKIQKLSIKQRLRRQLNVQSKYKDAKLTNSSHRNPEGVKMMINPTTHSETTPPLENSLIFDLQNKKLFEMLKRESSVKECVSLQKRQKNNEEQQLKMIKNKITRTISNKNILIPNYQSDKLSNPKIIKKFGGKNLNSNEKKLKKINSLSTVPNIQHNFQYFNKLRRISGNESIQLQPQIHPLNQLNRAHSIVQCNSCWTIPNPAVNTLSDLKFKQ